MSGDVGAFAEEPFKPEAWVVDDSVVARARDIASDRGAQLRVTHKRGRRAAPRVAARAVVDHARLVVSPSGSIKFELCELARGWG